MSECHLCREEVHGDFLRPGAHELGGYREEATGQRKGVTLIAEIRDGEGKQILVCKECFVSVLVEFGEQLSRGTEIPPAKGPVFIGIQ